MNKAISKLCYRRSDAELVEQLAECNPSMLNYISAEDWMMRGLTRKSAENMSSIMNLFNNILNVAKTSEKILSASDLINTVFDKIADRTVEHCYIVIVNNANKILRIERISDGGFTGVTMDVRVIAKKCLSYNGTGIFIVHNHPSDNLRPSQEDLNITKKICQAFSMLNLRVIDHVIVGNMKSRFYSFVEHGDL